MHVDREVRTLFSPATGTFIRAVGPLTWSLVMSLFQSPHTEEDLATTVAAKEANVTISTAWDAEVAVSTAGEAEGGSVPTGGPALSMSTQDPGEGDTPVSSLECMLHFTSFWVVVGISVEAVAVRMWITACGTKFE